MRQERLVSRRDFLRLTAASLAGVIAAACASRQPAATPEQPTPHPSPSPSETPPSPTARQIETPSPFPSKTQDPTETRRLPDTATPRPTFTPEATSTPEPLSTYEHILILKPGKFKEIGGLSSLSPSEIQESQAKLKVLAAAGRIPSAPEAGLSLLWFQDDSENSFWENSLWVMGYGLWATKVQPAEKMAEKSEMWILKTGEWQKKETSLQFVSGFTPYVRSLEEEPPYRYLGPEEGEVSWVLGRDVMETLVTQVSSFETGEETGVAVFWTGSSPLTIFGVIPLYLPEERERMKTGLTSAVKVSSEDSLVITVTDENQNPVGWWNLEKGGWTPDKENGVEYEDLFEEPEPTPTPPEVTEPMSFEVNFDPEVSAEIREKVFLTEAGEVRLKEAFYYALSGPFFEGRYGQAQEEVAAYLENNNWIIKDFRYSINAGKGAWGETTISKPVGLNLRKGIVLNLVAHAPEHETGIGLYQTGGRGIGFEIGVTDEGRLFITAYNPFLTDKGLEEIAGYGYEVPEHEVKGVESMIHAALSVLANHDENSLEASPDPNRYLGARDVDRVIVNAVRAAKGWKPAYSGPEVEKTMAILKERRGSQWENGLMLIPYSLIEGVFSISS